MERIFIKDELQQQFERDGFVKLTIINKEQAKYLYNYYLKTKTEHDTVSTVFHSTSDTNNEPLMRGVSAEIQKILIPELNKHLINYKVFIGNFLVKESGTGSETGLHQDWTFVDEEKYVSVNVWVALHDIYKKQGSLHFVRGSHKVMTTLRVSPAYPWAFEKIRPQLYNYIENFETLAGEGFILNHAIIHGAPENISGNLRLAAVLILYSNKADLSHYYLPNENNHSVIRKYKIQAESFLHLKKHQEPKHSEYVGDIAFDFKQIELPDFKKAIRENVPFTIRLKRQIKKLIHVINLRCLFA